MIFGGLLGLLMGRQLSVRQSLALQDAWSHRRWGTSARWSCSSSCRRSWSKRSARRCCTDVVGRPDGGAAVVPEHLSLGERVLQRRFRLETDNLMPYRRAWQPYAV